MSCADVFGRIWLDFVASNHVLVGFWSAFGRIWSVLVGCRHNSGFWTDNSGICSIILFPAALLRFIEVLLRPAILLYQGGVSEVCQRCIKRHDYGTITAGNGVIWRDSAGSGAIYGPLWPARGPLMAVYGGLRRLILSAFGRIRSFWLAFGWSAPFSNPIIPIFGR